MKITNQQELDKLIATADGSDTIVLKEDLTITFNCVIPCNIKAHNINAWHIDARDINAWHIDAHDIDARNINARHIDARDIDAHNINARDINYYAYCIAQKSFTCESVEGRRENSLHTCLYQKIKYI